MLIILENPLHAYMFGFLQADGHLYQGPGRKGNLTVEVSAADRPILEQFAAIVPCYSSITERVRDTNFKNAHRSAVWTVSDLDFREALMALGFPPGRKSNVVVIPSVPFSRPDYFRGLVDADGSLGLARDGLPFISLTTASDSLAGGYIDFVSEVTGNRKNGRRNSRDGIYNITVMREAATTLIATLYYDDCLALRRKIEKARQAVIWVRPDGMRRSPNRKSWTEDQDAFILSHTLEESMNALGRTDHSVKVRLRRLRQK
jgi:hypothetical protein